MSEERVVNLIDGGVLVSSYDTGKFRPDVYHLGCERDSVYKSIDTVDGSICGLERHDGLESGCESKVGRLDWYHVCGDRLNELRPCKSCLKYKYKLLGITGYPVQRNEFETWKGVVSFKSGHLPTL